MGKCATMWFITVFEKMERDERGWPVYGSRRTWGFFSDRDVAVRALHENWTDMREGIYDYAVIEGYDEGICHSHDPSEAQWFQWSEDREGYREINAPDSVAGFCNWAIC